MPRKSVELPEDPLLWPEVLTPGEVAHLAGIDPKTVGKAANAGELPCFRSIGGHRRFARADVKAWLYRRVANQPHRPTTG